MYAQLVLAASEQIKPHSPLRSPVPHRFESSSGGRGGSKAGDGDAERGTRETTEHKMEDKFMTFMALNVPPILQDDMAINTV